MKWQAIPDDPSDTRGFLRSPEGLRYKKTGDPQRFRTSHEPVRERLICAVQCPFVIPAEAGIQNFP
jgi:hypothetical protein